MLYIRYNYRPYIAFYTIVKYVASYISILSSLISRNDTFCVSKQISALLLQLMNCAFVSS